MSIKEFSQKNGVVLFYSTIVLLIITVILSFNCFCGKGDRKMGPNNFDRNQSGMMQNKNSQKDQTNIPSQNNQEQIPDQNQEVQ